jgi:hypothetical protein
LAFEIYLLKSNNWSLKPKGIVKNNALSPWFHVALASTIGFVILSCVLKSILLVSGRDEIKRHFTSEGQTKQAQLK